MPNIPLRRFALVAAGLAAAGLASCSGGGLSQRASASAGVFKVLSTNMANNDVWALNRPIALTFNHPVDPASISFASIIIRPVSSAVQGNPVTGSFEVSGDGKTVVFYPTCPTNASNTNGAFVPGGYQYELNLPTQQGTSGSSVLRDPVGHQLSIGLTRTFFSPTPPSDPLYIDLKANPPRVQSATFPAELNLFTLPDPIVAIRFDQPVDGRPSNLSSDLLYLLFADGEVGSASEKFFPLTNRVPGRLLLVENCGPGGALVYFVVTGILPPHRYVRLVVENGFADIAGQTNSFDQTYDQALPTLGEVYGDPFFDEEDETADEIQEEFDNLLIVDGEAPLAYPPAELMEGLVRASFDYPGVQVPADADFLLRDSLYLEVSTNGTSTITDSTGRIFTLQNGVLYVDDFTIEAGSGLRCRGRNPFVLYATGTVRIEGVLDASGNHALPPQALNAPHIPEPGALGECGGGDGGWASLETERETYRGGDGNAPFGATSGGGQGGEGGVQVHTVFGRGNADMVQELLAGGGAGGSFARTLNEAIYWSRWTGEEDPAGFDNGGPDFRSSKHTQLDPTGQDPLLPDPPDEMNFYGGEHGMRGSSYDSDTPEPPNTGFAFGPAPTNGVFGMEDLQRDTGANEEPPPVGQGFDPAWNTGDTPPFQFGFPTLGPDPGFTNTSVFSADGTTGNDFWGRRLQFDGTVTTGELLAPWAGYGGGASGDMSIVERWDLDGDTFAEPLNIFFPDPEFPTGTTRDYYKGAPGGGGGGQLQVIAIGPIILGAAAQVKANGGIGNGGESVWMSNNQVSGSGGGSGGHIVLHSATGLDLSAIDVGTVGVLTDPYSQLTDAEVVRAFGGRRGWAGSSQNDKGTLDPGGDGNSDFMTGRGGAGGNGVIQIHVPDPAEDIAWHPGAAAAILAYIQPGGPGTPVDTDRLEAVLEAYTAPQPYALIPFFAARSQVQTVWIDTGLAYLRDPANGSSAAYPDYDHPLLDFEGIASSGPDAGLVLASGGQVTPGAVIATGSGGVSGFQLVVPNASASFDDEYEDDPQLLVGYDVYPDSTSAASHQIVAASYSRALDRMVLTTRATDGAMAPGAVWVIREKFFRIDTTGTKNRLPDSASVRFEFQGADESFPGSNEPGTPTAWTSDLADLEGMRFIRWRVTFDLDAQGAGVSLGSERPELDYVKLPFVW